MNTHDSQYQPSSMKKWKLQLSASNKLNIEQPPTTQEMKNKPMRTEIQIGDLPNKKRMITYILRSHVHDTEITKAANIRKFTSAIK